MVIAVGLWTELVHALQFFFKSASHASSGHTPFMLVYGCHPNHPLELRDLDLHPRYTENETGQKLRIQAVLQREVIENEEVAWREQKRQHDKKSRSKKLTVGDVEYLNRPHIGS